MDKTKKYYKSLGDNTQCQHCQLHKTPENHDGCIGTLKGVTNACCGHGLDNQAYVQFDHIDFKNKPNKFRIAGLEALKYIKVLRLIKEISNSNPIMKDIFLAGSCCNFFFILKSVFPEAKAFFNIDHVITKIGDRYFDITGEIPNEEFIKKRYSPIDEFYPDKYKTDESVKAGEMYNPKGKDKYLRDKSNYIK